MLAIQERDIPGHETVLEATDPAIGYHAFLAVHSTRRGPAFGGTRFVRYPGAAGALADALQLAEAMSLKAALAGLPLGGGKAVLLQPAAGFDRAALFRTHGQAVEALGGRYITAGDVGTSLEDLEVIAEHTIHVAGRRGGMGDTAPFTARGLVQAMGAVAEVVFDRPSLAGIHVAVQGAGKVGGDLCRRLIAEGAIVSVADRNPAKAAATGGTVVPVETIHAVDADIFAPCALSGALHAAMVPELGARAVVGAANNQLAAPEVLDLLTARGICYLPDFLANAGGILSGCADLLGWSRDECLQRIDGIHDTAVRVLQEATARGEAPLEMAVRMARGALQGER
jgi:leucine dehydrogenase